MRIKYFIGVQEEERGAGRNAQNRVNLFFL